MANGSNVASTSTKRNRDGSTAVHDSRARKSTRSKGPSENNNNDNNENEPKEAAQPQEDDSEDDLAASRPAKRVVKPDNVARKQPAASTSAALKGKGKATEAASTAAKDVDTAAKRLAVRNLESENTKLRAQVQVMKDSHTKLQGLMSELRDVRHTEVETQLEEVVAQSDLRAETIRKQVHTYATETDELRTEVATLKEEIAKLRTASAANENAAPNGATQNGDETNDMEGEETTVIPETQFPENRSDRRQREAAEAAHAAEEAHRAEVQELEQHNRAAQDRIRELERTLKVQKQEQEEAGRKSIQELTLQHRKDIEAAQRTTTAALAKADQMEKELAFEIEQSKKLQTKAASNPQTLTASQSLAIPAGPSSSIDESARIAGFEAMQKLLLDLAGFTLLSANANGDSSTSRIYNFLMSDARKKITLHFKLIVGPSMDSATLQYDFIPEFSKGRDDELRRRLHRDLQVHIQFKEPQLSYFFKRLYLSMNS